MAFCDRLNTMSRKNKKRKSFWSENGVGISLVALTVIFGLGLPASVYIRQAQLDKEYDRLATQGSQIEGTILKHVYSEGSWHPMARKTKFHVDVEIEFRDAANETKRLSEKWPAGRRHQPSDKTGSKITLYYLPDNKSVKIASMESPRLKTALKSSKPRDPQAAALPSL